MTEPNNGSTVEDASPSRPMPWFKWWACTWLGSPEIRGLSLEARGLLADLRSLAHQSVPPGSLTSQGRPLTEKELARRVGSTPCKVRKLLGEIELAGILRRQDETLTLPDIVEEVRISREKRHAGRKGAEAAWRNHRGPSPDASHSRERKEGEGESAMAGAMAEKPAPRIFPSEAETIIETCEGEISRLKREDSSYEWGKEWEPPMGGYEGRYVKKKESMKQEVRQKLALLEERIKMARAVITGIAP